MSRRLTRPLCAALAALIVLLGLPVAVSAAESRPPRFEAQTLSDAHYDQASRLYRTTLGREADPQGAEYWAGLLAEGYSPRRLAASLLASEEYKLRTSGDTIVDAYLGALGRRPEPAGYEFWSQFSDPTVVVVAISDSLEHQVITGTLPPPARVERVTAHPQGWVDAGHGVFVPPVLLEIRWCESRDDYRAANPRSTARGAYQFLTGSWAAYGHAARYGVSRAHLATPAQQDEAALLTWQQSGTRPWNASRHCWG